MNNLLSCRYNTDTNRVEAWFEDGTILAIDCIAVEDEYGNIGQVSCLMSTLMGGVSGSAVADASMECRILGPEMNRLGYDRGWSAAINGLSGLIVATIPPSMGLIIYGTVGEVSIGRLFMAGWVPGILMLSLIHI